MKNSQFRNSLIAASTLFVSIASLVQAVPYASNLGGGGGLWGDPASWLPAGSPDTFIGDTVTISLDQISYEDATSGFPVMSTPASPFSPAGGAFAVAKGGTILVTGASALLTQGAVTSTPTEIRIGDGFAGAGMGVGTLTIDVGASFNSGTAIGVGVGTDINNANGVPATGFGNGLVNLNDGFFVMGANSQTGGLGIGVEGSMGVMNVGNGAGLAGTAVLELALNETATTTIDVAIGATNQVSGTAGNGKLYIKSDGIVNQGRGAIIVGEGAGGVGLIEITGGKLGNGASTTGELRIGSTGGMGTFTMNVGGGKVSTVGEFNIGRGAFANGTANVNIGASDLFSVGNTSVGRDTGIGAWNLDGAATVAAVNGQLQIGRESGSTGTVNVQTGSTLNVGGDLNVGNEGHGTLTIDSGAAVHQTAGWTQVGRAGTGSDGLLDVKGGGLFESNNALIIASESNSTGKVNITGATSKIKLTGGNSLLIGRFSTGELNQSGGTVEIQGWGGLGFDPGGRGTYNLSGGTLAWTNSSDNDFFLGRVNNSVGTLNLTGAGTVSLLVDGANPTIDQRHGGRLVVGNDSGSEGILNIDPGTSLAVRELSLNNGKGTVTQNGGTVTVGRWLKIGEGDNTNDAPNPPNPTPNEAIYTINDGSITTPELMIGEGRRGTMVINGGTVNISNGGFGIGRWGPGRDGNPNWHGDGKLIQGGGTLRNNFQNNDSRIGTQPGTFGAYTISAGDYQGILDGVNGDVGARTGSHLIIGDENNSSGTLTVDGGVVGVRQLTVGQNGKANVTQNGGTVTVAQWLKIGAGDNLNDAPNPPNPTPNTASYTLNAGTLNTPELMVGEGRRGEMTINGGTVNIQNGSFAVGRWGPGWNGNANWHGEGKLTHTGGTINNFSGDTSIGVTNGAKGTYNISGTAELRGLTNAGNGDPGARGGMRLYVGNENGSIGEMTIDGGLIEVNSFTPGNNGKATVTQNGGTINVGQWMEVGQGNAADNAANVASYTMNGGVINAQQLVVGTRRAGLMTVNGGTINLGTDGTVSNPGWGDFAVGRDGGGADHGNGHLVVHGGTINATGKNFEIARGGPNTQGLVEVDGGNIFVNLLTVGGGGATNAVITLSGGNLETNGDARVGEGVGTIGTLNLSGTGILKTGGEWQVGNNGGTGVANITGGTVNALGYVAIGRNTDQNGGANGGNGTVNLSGGTINKVNNNGTFDIGSWNGGNNATINTTGTLTQTGGIINNTVSDTHIGRDTGVVGTWTISAGTAALARLNVGNSGKGTLTMTGGSISASDRVSVGANGGSQGFVNLNGGVLTTNFVEAGGGTADLSFDGGTLRATQDQADFIRGFTSSGGHSAIQLKPGDGTIDTNGFNVRITAANVISNPGDVTINGLAGTVLNKAGAGQLTLEGAAGDGKLSVHALAGTLDFESSQTLDSLVIDGGAIVTISAPFSAPAPPVAPGAALEAALNGGSIFNSPSGLTSADSSDLAAGVQGVPEPGTLSLLLLSGLGLLGRRPRGKRA